MSGRWWKRLLPSGRRPSGASEQEEGGAQPARDSTPARQANRILLGGVSRGVPTVEVQEVHGTVTVRYRSGQVIEQGEPPSAEQGWAVMSELKRMAGIPDLPQEYPATGAFDLRVGRHQLLRFDAMVLSHARGETLVLRIPALKPPPPGERH